jgi:hypothetical protein
MNKAYLAYLNRLLVQEIEAHKRRLGRHTVLEPVWMQNRRWCYRQWETCRRRDCRCRGKSPRWERRRPRGRRDEELASSRAERFPKTLSPLSCTGSQGTGFWRPTVPARGARRKTGWGRLLGSAKLWRQEAMVAVCCVFAERSDLFFIATQGGEQAAREAKWTARRWTKQSHIHFPLRQIVSASTWLFSSIVQSCVTKRKARHRGTIRKPRRAHASWRGEAWRGRRRRRRSVRERAFFLDTLTTRGRAHLICWSNSF